MKACETSARKGEQASCRVPMPPASQRLGGHGEKKACKTQTIKIQVWVPRLYSQLWIVVHGAIHSTEEFSFHLLRGFNNMEQMKDVSHPGILSGQQCII